MGKIVLLKDAGFTNISIEQMIQKNISMNGILIII